MNEHDITLKNRNQQVGGVVTSEGIKAGAIDWQAVGDAFLANFSDRRGTTMRDTSKRVQNAVTLLTAAKGRPTDGKGLM